MDPGVVVQPKLSVEAAASMEVGMERVPEDQPCEACGRIVWIRLMDMNTDEESEPVFFWVCLDCVKVTEE
jgi:hypothetical protein